MGDDYWEIPECSHEPTPEPSPDKIDEILAKCSPQFELLRTALHRTDVHSDCDYEEGLPVFEFHLTRRNVVAGILARAAVHRHRQGRGREALEFLTMLIGVGQDRARFKPVEQQCKLVLTEILAGEKAREILSAHSLASDELAEFARQLDVLDSSRPGIAEALEINEAMIRRSLVTYLRTGRFPPGPERSWTPWRFPRFLGSRRLAVAAALDHVEWYYMTLLAAAEKPSHMRSDVELEVDAKIDSGNPFVSAFVAHGSNYRFECIGLLFRVLIRLGVAVGRYEVDEGRYPAGLEELVPKYIDAVPLCPMTGEPFRFKEGKIWSIGSDRKDDGGQPLDDSGKGDEIMEVRRK